MGLFRKTIEHTTREGAEPGPQRFHVTLSKHPVFNRNMRQKEEGGRARDTENIWRNKAENFPSLVNVTNLQTQGAQGTPASEKRSARRCLGVRRLKPEDRERTPEAAGQVTLQGRGSSVRCLTREAAGAGGGVCVTHLKS